MFNIIVSKKISLKSVTVNTLIQYIGTMIVPLSTDGMYVDNITNVFVIVVSNLT